MADYSGNATQLSAPQAAGAQVVAPVEVQAVPNNAVMGALGNIADIFANGLKQNAKAEAQKRENEIVGQYVKEQTRINDGIAQGVLDAGTAGARSRASANKFLASYPEYYKEFEAAGKALKGITEQGEVQDQLTMERNLYKEQISKAQAAGFNIDPSAPKNVIDLQLKSYNVGVRAETELRAMYSANAEKRAQSAEDRLIADKELKATSIRLLNDIGGARLESTGAVMTSIATDVRSGKITPEEGNIKLTQEFATINATLQSAASTSPELAAPYRTLFGEMQKLGQDMLDPKKRTEDQDNQIKELLNRQKLLILATPQHAALVATSQLLGANAQVALTAGATMTPLIAQMINVPVGSKDFVPQVVGNPAVEKDVTTFLKSSINSLSADKYKNPTQAKTELTNTINQVLKQTGEQLNKGVDAPKLKDLASFFASSEYGSYATSGNLDKAAAQAANKTFQLSYEPAVIKGVQQKLESFLQGQAAYGQKQGDPVPLSEAVDIKFSGSGIVFSAKPRAGLDPVEQQDQMRAVKDLSSTQTALNQLIHIGAHLEGTTDYQKYWEDKKHVFVPQLFPDPARLKVGDVVNGYKYIGGPDGNPRSWQPVSQ